MGEQIEAIERIIIEPTAPRIGNAWISPDGKFYPVPNIGDHDLIGNAIIEKLFPYAIDKRDLLAKLRWIHLYDQGVFWVGYEMGKFVSEITQPQLDVLFDLVRINTFDSSEIQFQRVLTEWIVWYCTKDAKTE